MDGRKVGSIWDEVDALQKEKEVSEEGGKFAENTRLEVAENKENESVFTNNDSSQNGLKENNVKLTTEENPARTKGFEMKLIRDDQAEKKGFISIIALALCVLVLVGATVSIVNIVRARNSELKASQEEMDKLDRLRSLEFTDASGFFGGVESIWSENIESEDNRTDAPKENEEETGEDTDSE
ncbi:MAG: hypothetical protein K5776_08065 [Lachnospiraceae bacterium]|nr:hypothetical protein [Lachnospiraceae bacterium]